MDGAIAVTANAMSLAGLGTTAQLRTYTASSWPGPGSRRQEAATMKGYEVLYGQGKATPRGMLPTMAGAEPVSHPSPSRSCKPLISPKPLFLLLPRPDLNSFSSETPALFSFLVCRSLVPRLPTTHPGPGCTWRFPTASSAPANSHASRENGPNLFGLELPRGTGLAKTELGLGKQLLPVPICPLCQQLAGGPADFSWSNRRVRRKGAITEFAGFHSRWRNGKKSARGRGEIQESLGG